MLVEQLKSIVGDVGWKTDPTDLEPHLNEWRDTWRGQTPIMVMPATTAEVAAVVRACAAAGTAIVPQGGNTGLCGGAIPAADGSQVLLSLSRLRKIRNIDVHDHSILVEAGCTLAEVQAAAQGAGRFFPLSLAAEGSCQIGGNLSTNAGGINVLRYGTARSLALGLEVVLANGDIWDGLSNLRKDTAGYDLKQLFIGSEGTLGIITAATLKLFPAVTEAQSAVVALTGPDAAILLLAELRQKLADQVQAFELIPGIAVEFVNRHIPSSRFPVDSDCDWYALLEFTGTATGDRASEVLMGALDAGLIEDAVLAKNQAESESMWRFRHAISEAQKREGASLKHDVSVPVGAVAEFIADASAAVVARVPGIRPVPFGHIGDGNIHFNLSQPADGDSATFLALRDELADVVYDVVSTYRGSISAEHGVGVAKRDALRRYKSETEITLMRTLKRALDPQNLLNPGKVI